MDAFERWQYLLTFLLAAVPWFFPTIALSAKIIILLVVFLISLFLYVLQLQKKIKTIDKEAKEIKERHQALAQQFNEKRSELELYSHAFESAESLIICAMQSTRNERLVILYDSFMRMKASLFMHERMENHDWNE